VKVVHRKQAGYTFPELFAALGLCTVFMGMAVSNVRVLGNPVQSGALQLASVLQQARSKAIATNWAYTVYPVSSNEIAVKYGRFCGSKDIKIDSRLRFRIPKGAELAETGWRVCFASRGLPTDNAGIFVRDKSNPALAVGVDVYLGGNIRIQ
jgi:hypothetical protein